MAGTPPHQQAEPRILAGPGVRPAPKTTSEQMGAAMAVINVRKARAGTDSAGHRWPADGAVIPVPVEHALALTQIPDGGFSIIDTPPSIAAADAVSLLGVNEDETAVRSEPDAKTRPARAAKHVKAQEEPGQE
jgi:hypothetical protein